MSTFVDLTDPIPGVDPEPFTPARPKDAPVCSLCKDRKVSIYRVGADSKSKIFDEMCGICSAGVAKNGYGKFIPTNRTFDSCSVKGRLSGISVSSELAPGRTPIEVLVLEFLFPFEFIPAQIGKMGFGGRLGRYHNRGNGCLPNFKKLDMVQTDLLDWWIEKSHTE